MVVDGDHESWSIVRSYLDATCSLRNLTNMRTPRSVPVATTARMVYGYLQAYEVDWTYNADLYLWLK